MIHKQDWKSSGSNYCTLIVHIISRVSRDNATLFISVCGKSDERKRYFTKLQTRKISPACSLMVHYVIAVFISRCDGLWWSIMAWWCSLWWSYGVVIQHLIWFDFQHLTLIWPLFWFYNDDLLHCESFYSEEEYCRLLKYFWDNPWPLCWYFFG